MRMHDLVVLEQREMSQTAQLFDKVAKAQRGAPERKMVELQFLLGGGVFPYVIEHVGDITHRMSENFDFAKGQLSLVQDKVEKTLRTLESGYGFEREMMENFRTNFAFRQERGKAEHNTVEEFIKAAKKLSMEYAFEHRRVPVFNEPQKRARAAAVALGEWKFKEAVLHLRWLLNLTEDAEAYKEAVSQVTMEEGTDNSFFLSPLKGRGPTIYPLPSSAKKYRNIDSKRRGGAKVKVRNGNKTTRNQKAKHSD
jgi:hypothetical protein